MLELSPLYLLLAVPILFLLIILCKRKEYFPYYACDTLMTTAELKFYQALKSVTQNRYQIAPKVRLGDVITCDEISWHKGYGPKISAKHVDFVLFDEKTSAILCCIELDDRSHRQPNRIKRDKFINKALKTADVPLIRIPVSKGYDLAHIEKEIALALR